MFEISWAELGFVMAVGVAAVGRKDLPMAARTAGNYTGRFVGWLQGMRTRADRFTAQHELSTLQNQVRLSMRELQAVQAEVISASSVRSTHISSRPYQPISSTHSYNSGNAPAITPPNILSKESSFNAPTETLSPASRSIAAVAESEWARQGLGFISRAELGSYGDTSPPGSVILARAIQESLVYDQYDRVVREQQEALESSPSLSEEKKISEDSPKKVE